MTWNEAKKRMRNGERITHRFFTDNEWMTIERGKILFEDGVTCSITEFRADRESWLWDEDYSIWKEPVEENCDEG